MSAVAAARVTELDDEARLKLVIMRLIDAHLRRNFRTLQEAADHFDIGWPRLSRLRAGLHQQFSIAWLLDLAKTSNTRMRINIESPD